jgi:energy-coupling factor transporter ATP-binding protein EcfA2
MIDLKVGPNMGVAIRKLTGQSGAVGVAASDAACGKPISLACLRQSPPVRSSARTATVRLQFGMPPGGQTISIAPGATIQLAKGSVILLTGPSGSGKSSALSAIESHFAPPPPAQSAHQLQPSFEQGADPFQPPPLPRGDRGGSPLNVQQVEFSVDCAIIDEVAPHADLAEAASILTACGLGEASLWLRPYAALSEGEKFRARLARAISLQANIEAANNGVHPNAPTNRPPSQGGPQWGKDSQRAVVGSQSPPILICDEFCSGLHRRAAKAIAHNLRKLVSRRGLCVVVACSTDDLIADLDPDTVVQFAPSGCCQVNERTPSANAASSLRRKLCIEPGMKRDYETFAGMHYRGTDELGFVDRVFILREGAGGEPLGIVVYSHPALELSLRNKANNGWFSRNPQRVNKHLRILRRLVIHPDVRGCGLGHYLVRKTMPLLGTEYVECLAAMGEFNPVFERAGMVRIGQYDAPSGPKAALEALRAMDVDPQSAEFAIDVARRPAVRNVVAQTVADWYAATTAGGEKRVERQSPDTLARTFRGLIGVRPVYYLWRRGRESTPRKSKIFPIEPIHKCR